MTEAYLQYGGQSLGWHFGLWNGPSESVKDALQNSNRLIIEGCDLRPGQLVLDAGCGVGGLSFYLAQEFGVRVVGITISRQHVELATRFAREKNLQDQVEFRFLNFMDLDYEENKFDFVFNQETFCYVLDKKSYLDNIRSVLKPGGRWQTVDFFMNDQPLNKEQAQYHQEIQQGWKTAPLSTWKSIEDTLYELNFEDICTKDLSDMAYPTAFLFIYKAIEVEEKRGQGKKPVDPSEAAFVANAAACAAYSRGLFEGAFTYHLIGGAKGKE